MTVTAAFITVTDQEAANALCFDAFWLSVVT